MTKDEFDKLAALHKAIWKKKGIDAHPPNCLCVYCELTDSVKVDRAEGIGQKIKAIMQDVVRHYFHLCSTIQTKIVTKMQ